MGYLYLFLQALMFSFGGLMIKASNTMISPLLLSFFRFVIGTGLLLIIEKVRTGRLHLHIKSIIIFGGIMKALHYLTENLGVTMGFSYGGILVWPVQTVAVMAFSCLIRKERFSSRVILGVILCVAGIGLVSWNGAPASVFLDSQATTLLLFVLAGIAAAGFSIAQKKLVNSMNIVELNSSMFIFSLMATTLMLPPTGPHVTGPANPAAILSVIAMGIITCVGFLLQAAAIRTVPLLYATIIQSSTVLLSIVWGVLIYGDPISAYIIAGSVIFLTGILLVNLPGRGSPAD